MQLKQFYNIATKVSSRKSATTFGDLPDCCKYCALCRSHVRECSNWGNVCLDLYDFERCPLTCNLYMDLALVNGNCSRKFNDDTMTGELWIRRDGQTDWQTGPFLELLGRS